MKRILPVLLALSLLLPLLSLSAFAGEPTAAERGYEAIMATGHGELIVLPQPESYLDSWQTRYARRAWYAPSLYVESVPQLRSGAPCVANLFEGSRVTVVAEENGMSCILYQGVNYKRYAGWIPSVRLLEDFPGERFEIGQAGAESAQTLAEAELRWSGEYFPGTQQPYTVLTEPISGCVGFLFEYQLTARNTSLEGSVLGPRTLYVRDGDQWLEVASFPYAALGAVQVQVSLERPVELTAIATVADCHAPNMFDFRQTARDFRLSAEG